MNRVAALLAAACRAVSALAAGSAHADDAELYVALGDSYTAAPLVPNQ